MPLWEQAAMVFIFKQLKLNYMKLSEEEKTTGILEVEIVSKEYIIPACSGIKIDVKQGQNITVIDTEGGQVVDFFAEVTGSQNEFLSTGVTIDCNESLKLALLDITLGVAAVAR